MPFHSIHRPNLAIGLLKEIINTRTNSKCDTYDLNIWFASMIKKEFGDLSKYFLISDSKPNAMIGEFIFSKYIEGNITEDHIYSFINTLIEQKIFPAKISKRETHLELYDIINQLLKITDQFMKKLLEINWSLYDIIGFSVTFQQLMSSLSLASEVKKRWPQTNTVFGGNTVHSKMGMAYSKKYENIVDTFFIGEGEEAIVDYIISFDKNEIPKIVMQDRTTNLDTNPIPDFYGYFSTMDDFLHYELMKSSLTYEFSRGCWWGQKKKCLFCGLNCDAIDYRYKNIKKSCKDVKEIVERYEAYGVKAILLTDSIIPHTYYGNLSRFNEINTKFYFETKSNFNRDEHFKEMVESGFIFSQPGIESLSDKTLKHINKGVTTLQNIKFLIQCRNYNIFVTWNIIFGFLEETNVDIKNQISIINKIKHLPSPMNVSKFRLDRYSVYFDNYAKQLIMTGVKKTYYHIFRETKIDEEMCYYFDYKFNQISEDIEIEFNDVIKNWQLNSKKYKKEIRRDEDGIYLFKYYGNSKEIIRLNHLKKDIVLKTRNIISYEKLISELINVYPVKDIKFEVDNLIFKEWIISIDDKILFIGVDRTKSITFG